MAGYSDSTKQQYESHLVRITNLFGTVNISVKKALHYLKRLFDEGKSYSTINTARSAISQLITITDTPSNKFGELGIVAKFMKGVFRLRPPLPKYKGTWDAKILLDFLRSINTESCNLKELSMKLACLIALTTGQRVQTLAALDIEYLARSDIKATFHVRKVLKVSKPGLSTTVFINKYDEVGICPLTTLNVYLDKTASLRRCSSLFIGLQKPHNAIGSQTIARWINLGLTRAGIDPTFTAHSTRHAAGSSAAKQGISINTILSTVGWRNEYTFARFYRRDTVNSDELFTEAVLTGDKTHQ